MRYLMICGAAALLTFLGRVAPADVKVAFDHNDVDHATPDFKFKDVPSPAKTNAAIEARFSIADGDKDENGGDLAVLHDGKLPETQDEPAANFFFNAGTSGGRIVVDLGSAIDIKEINTYSWHTDTRAAQVYSVYATDGADAGFEPSPSGAVDPEKCGWKLIAKVDTRPKTDPPGGQYGVNISDSKDVLGKFRYVLFAVSRTEGDDDFGNTFFSEIQIIDAHPAPAATQPATKPAVADDGNPAAKPTAAAPQTIP